MLVWQSLSFFLVMWIMSVFRSSSRLKPLACCITVQGIQTRQITLWTYDLHKLMSHSLFPPLSVARRIKLKETKWFKDLFTPRSHRGGTQESTKMFRENNAVIIHQWHKLTWQVYAIAWHTSTTCCVSTRIHQIPVLLLFELTMAAPLSSPWLLKIICLGYCHPSINKPK